MELFGSNGFVFASARVFKLQGAYTMVPQRPDTCDKCAGGSLHAHGRYKRSLQTLKNRVLRRVKVWRHRWLCLCCGRTMRPCQPPPMLSIINALPHMPNKTLLLPARSASLIAVFKTWEQNRDALPPLYGTRILLLSHTVYR